MTNQELLSKIVNNGGKILLVGENFSRRFQTDSKDIIIWDDVKNNLNHKSIPSTIKVFIWSKFISHSLVNRLNNAVSGYHGIKFPFLSNREIEELLRDFLKKDSIEIKTEEHMTLKEFINKNLDNSIDYLNISGSKGKEQKRLLELAKKQNFQTTEQSLAKMFSKIMKERGLNVVRKPKVKKVQEKVIEQQEDNSFTEFLKLIDDAIAGLSLAKEISSNWKNQLNKIEEIKEKLRNL